MKILLAVFPCLVGLVCGLYSSSDDVVELTAANFNTRVLQSNELWLVEFYAPWCGHCKSLAPEWKKAATALKGIVNIGAVDMVDHQSVGSPYNVQGFPTIKVFGSNKQKPEDYSGARTASAIVDSAMSHLKTIVNGRLGGKTGGSSGGGGGGGGGSCGGGGGGGSCGGGGGGGGSCGGGGGSGGKKSSGGDGNAEDVVELTDSNFEELVLRSDDMWLVEFFAPWCGHCKNLAPHWQSAATQLKGKVKLGALDATIHTVMASRYGVRGYPTIKMFPSGKKDNDALEFDGGRTSDDIVSWALDKLAANIPPPEVIELTDESVLKTACEDHQLCIVAVLPHILDCQSKCRNSYISLMKTLGEKHKKKQWAWVWAEAGAQTQVEEALNIGGFGYPAMAAINARKMKFALLKGSFSEKGLNEFLLEVAVGRSSTDSVRAGQLPKVLTVPAWDGKDGEMPVEEDYDLDEELDELPPKKTEL